MGNDATQGHHIVFVYGTLKRGHPNAHVGMPRAKYLGDYRTTEHYPLVIGGRYFTPFLIREPGQGFQVTGELYAIDDSILAELDDLESVHLERGYRRFQIPVEPIAAVASQTHQTAWTNFRERHHIDGIHDGPIATYPIDQRYVAVSAR